MDSNKKVKRSITAPLSGYVSGEGREAIRRLQAAGFDYDLAFSIAESSLPQEVFYDIYELPEDVDDGE